MAGVKMALTECQFQVRWTRWGCADRTLDQVLSNPGHGRLAFNVLFCWSCELSNIWASDLKCRRCPASGRVCCCVFVLCMCVCWFYLCFRLSAWLVTVGVIISIMCSLLSTSFLSVLLFFLYVFSNPLEVFEITQPVHWDAATPSVNQAVFPYSQQPP